MRFLHANFLETNYKYLLKKLESLRTTYTMLNYQIIRVEKNRSINQ